MSAPRRPNALPCGATSLERLMAEQGMTQPELAARSGVSRETINKICRGRLAKVGPQRVVCLAYGLGVAPQQLADLTDWLPLGGRDLVSYDQYVALHGARAIRELLAS